MKIEIKTEEEALKWVGRRARSTWRNYRDGYTGDHAIVEAIEPPRSRPSGCVGYANWLMRYSDDPDRVCYVVIELLDGAPTPRPAGEGWVWCQHAEDARDRFLGKTCEIVGGELKLDYGTYPPARARGVVRSRGGDYVGAGDHTFDVATRGGVWIREISEPPHCQPPQIDEIQGNLEEARSALEAERRNVERLERQLADAKQVAEREDENARWPLPGGWEWRDACHGPFSRSAWSGDFEVFATRVGHLGMIDHEDDGWAHAPFAVARAVMDRYGAGSEA